VAAPAASSSGGLKGGGGGEIRVSVLGCRGWAAPTRFEGVWGAAVDRRPRVASGR
jgi:hypothetical protein